MKKLKIFFQINSIDFTMNDCNFAEEISLIRNLKLNYVFILLSLKTQNISIEEKKNTIYVTSDVLNLELLFNKYIYIQNNTILVITKILAVENNQQLLNINERLNTKNIDFPKIALEILNDMKKTLEFLAKNMDKTEIMSFLRRKDYFENMCQEISRYVKLEEIRFSQQNTSDQISFLIKGIDLNVEQIKNQKINKEIIEDFVRYNQKDIDVNKIKYFFDIYQQIDQLKTDLQKYYQPYVMAVSPQNFQQKKNQLILTILKMYEGFKLPQDLCKKNIDIIKQIELFGNQYNNDLNLNKMPSDIFDNLYMRPTIPLHQVLNIIQDGNMVLNDELINATLYGNQYLIHDICNIQNSIKYHQIGMQSAKSMFYDYTQPVLKMINTKKNFLQKQYDQLNILKTAEKKINYFLNQPNHQICTNIDEQNQIYTNIDKQKQNNKYINKLYAKLVDYDFLDILIEKAKQNNDLWYSYLLDSIEKEINQEALLISKDTRSTVQMCPQTQIKQMVLQKQLQVRFYPDMNQKISAIQSLIYKKAQELDNLKEKKQTQDAIVLKAKLKALKRQIKEKTEVIKVYNQRIKNLISNPNPEIEQKIQNEQLNAEDSPKIQKTQKELLELKQKLTINKQSLDEIIQKEHKANLKKEISELKQQLKINKKLLNQIIQKEQKEIASNQKIQKEIVNQIIKKIQDFEQQQKKLEDDLERKNYYSTQISEIYFKIIKHKRPSMLKTPLDQILQK